MAGKTILLQKANEIEQVFNAIGDGRPLTIEEMDTFYRNTDAVRSELPARRRLHRIISRSAEAGVNSHILFVGARGSGKSTELNHLQKDLLNEIAVVNYSVMKELDPQSISYIELFIVTMEKLFSLALTENLDIDESFIERITNWTRTKEIEEIKDKHLSAEVSAGINAKVGIPFLQEFFFKLKGAAKASKSFKETLKDTIEPRLSDLINYCNELISEVRQRLINRQNACRDLVIIIEDLDKIPFDNAQKLFFNYANQLVQLKATVIYTYPVTLYYNIRFNMIKAYFSEIVELPMIKIYQKDGQPYEEGIQTLRDIVSARMNNTLFASDDILTSMILNCGGVIRDLFKLIKEAAESADTRGNVNIQLRDYSYAYNQLKKDYENTIADWVEEGKIRYKATEFYTSLGSLAKAIEKKPDNSEILMFLRQNLSVLSYNGEGWCDVHPIVKDILQERGYLN